MAKSKPHKVLTEKQIQKLENLIREGKTTKQIAKAFKVSESTIYNWKKLTPEIQERMRQALKDSALSLTELAQEVADDESQDIIYDPDTGRPILNSVKVQRAKLRMGQMNRRAAIADPATYGEKQQIEMSGGLGGGTSMMTTWLGIDKKTGAHIGRTNDGMMIVCPADKWEEQQSNGAFFQITAPDGALEEDAFDYDIDEDELE